ncbi:hypothetical protein CXG81DRAFT_28261 [Caulochytrium protostelioides]|uniref:DUF1206 domain-containing protein n=1 Tax=Caulochytrium protostelioides TaxID=1555241 RepID=A0A4P9X1W9_9FUNG|nr:hypothetical protein CXG81DRAFT_28261 [Caulochytrium protostelioides]|eukprot:RKO98958.1 hypothetical protein CXG81DRAFT_28261 [Caulochytrium protostelioides]
MASTLPSRDGGRPHPPPTASAQAADAATSRHGGRDADVPRPAGARSGDRRRSDAVPAVPPSPASSSASLSSVGHPHALNPVHYGADAGAPSPAQSSSSATEISSNATLTAPSTDPHADGADSADEHAGHRDGRRSAVTSLATCSVRDDESVIGVCPPCQCTGSALKNHIDGLCPEELAARTRLIGFSEMVKSENYAFGPTDVRVRWVRLVRIVGRIGFACKGLVYALIGILTIMSAHDPTNMQDESPQGAFLFLGMQNSGLLAVLLLGFGLLCYLTWRFLEGITGIGAHDSGKPMFFKFRFAPVVSGAVYTSYLYYLLEILMSYDDGSFNYGSTSDEGGVVVVSGANPSGASSGSSSLAGSNDDSPDFPDKWTHSTIGLIGLAFVALAFLIAALTQIVPAITGRFRDELEFRGTRRFWRIVMEITGRIGIMARGALFAAMAALFISALAGTLPHEKRHHNSSPISQSINQLIHHRVGRAAMAILGTGLVIYGLFAVLNLIFRRFPTYAVPYKHVLPEIKILERRRDIPRWLGIPIRTSRRSLARWTRDRRSAADLRRASAASVSSVSTTSSSSSSASSSSSRASTSMPRV